MRTVAFVTQKGGAGKSTLAACVGVAAAEAGEKVFLLDVDPQGSLMSWGESRAAEKPEVDTIAPAKLDAALQTLSENGYTLAILDTAGTDSPAAAAAIKASDLCLIPCRPSAFDIRATEPTYKAIVALGRSYGFVLNQCPPGLRNSRTTDGARALEVLGGDCVSGPIVARVDFQTAAVMGLGVTELGPSSKAAEEIRELWHWVNRRLGANTHAKARRIA